MYTAKINNKEYTIEFDGKSSEIGKINGTAYTLDVLRNGKSFHVIKDNRSYTINIPEINYDIKKVILEINNTIYEVNLTDEIDVLLKTMGLNNHTKKISKDLKAPMPGLVTEIHVAIGQEILKGQNILVLEAMKMENNLKAENDCIIKDIIIKKGNSVEKNELLITFE